jgi:hypothetical protein
LLALGRRRQKTGKQTAKQKKKQAAVADLVANLIYFSEETKNPLEKKVSQTKKSFAKTAYKGATRGN